MVTISTGKILLIIYGLSMVCAIISISTEITVFTSSSRGKAYAAFLIIGIISLAVVLVTEILLNFVESVRDNKIAQMISIGCMVAAGVSLIIACAIYHYGHYSYGWTVASCTLIMEAILIFSLLRFFS